MSITASLMEGESGGSSLPLPSGHVDEPLLLESSAPRAGLPCPSPAPSPLTEHPWAFPQDCGGRPPVQAAQCLGALLLGTAEQRHPPGVDDLGVLLACPVACFTLLLSGHGATQLGHVGTSGAAPILGEGGHPADPEAFLRRRPGGRGWLQSLTLRQVFVSTESIVNPGVSLACSVCCCFLIFINAYFNLNLRSIPVQFHVDNF